jgi:phage baseplate assembly protein gpV
MSVSVSKNTQAQPSGGGGSSSFSQSSLAQNPASGSVVLTLLSASHTAGLYQIGCYAKVNTAPTTGTTTPTLAYSDSGAQSIEMFPAPQNMVPAGTLNFFTTTLQSDGVSAVTVTFDFASVTGTGSVDFYAWGIL